jgi:hypothetical protein
VIVVAFLLAAVGMAGAFFERAAPERTDTMRVVGEPETLVEPGPPADDSSTGDSTAVPPTTDPGVSAPGPESPIGSVTISRDLAPVTADYAFQGSLASWIDADETARFAGTHNLVETGHRGTRFAFELVSERSYRSVLRFARRSGLMLAGTGGILHGRSYTIELLFRFDRVDGYRKILDFEGARSDTGLYSFEGCLSFFDRAQAARSTIEADRFAHVVLTRDVAGTVVGYVDGVTSFSFVDHGELAVIDPDDTLRFFGDDVETRGRESSSGAVARIRLYDGPIGADAVADACVELLGETCEPPTTA